MKKNWEPNNNKVPCLPTSGSGFRANGELGSGINVAYIYKILKKNQKWLLRRDSAKESSKPF